MKELKTILLTAIAVFSAVLCANLLTPDKQVVVQIPENKIENPVVVDVPDELGRLDEKKVFSATSSKISVGPDVHSLLEFMVTADSTIDGSYFNGVNHVVIQPIDGTIRHQVGTSALKTDAGFSAGTTGGKVFPTWQQPISANPAEIYLRRDSGETATITVQVVSYGTDR